MVESSILKFWFLEAFEKFHKLGCVVRMVVESILPHAKFEPNDHRKDAPLFIHTLVSNEIWVWHLYQGDDDNGTLFTEEEYEAYKKKVFPLRLKNRLYVAWQNSQGRDCKLIGPETKCHCQCRYKNHVTDVADPNAKGARKLKCKKCSCKGFMYVWSQGNGSRLLTVVKISLL